MKMSELARAAHWLDTKLQDDETPTGGIAFRGETLKDFLCDALDFESYKNAKMSVINPMLKSCGIKPIDYQFANERKQFSVMIGIYLGALSDDDRLCLINDIIKAANEYDFDMTNEDGEWLINTENARFAAQKIAEELAKGD